MKSGMKFRKREVKTKFKKYRRKRTMWKIIHLLMPDPRDSSSTRLRVNRFRLRCRMLKVGDRNQDARCTIHDAWWKIHNSGIGIRIMRPAQIYNLIQRQLIRFAVGDWFGTLRPSSGLFAMTPKRKIWIKKMGLERNLIGYKRTS